MNTIDFLTEQEFSSYEEFQRIIEDQYKKDVEIFLDSLSALKAKADEMKQEAFREIKSWLKSARYSFFPSNCLHLYRWLISEGWKTFEDDKIDAFYEFIDAIRVTELAVKKVQWGVPFMVRDGFEDIETFWKKQILNRFNMEGKDSLTFTELVNYFLVYHIGVKQLLTGNGFDLSETREKVVTNYMNIVNRFPEIEEIFGVAIEKEMFKVYEILKKRKNEKTKKSP
jgi:hypothetical protein